MGGYGREGVDGAGHSCRSRASPSNPARSAAAQASWLAGAANNAARPKSSRNAEPEAGWTITFPGTTDPWRDRARARGGSPPEAPRGRRLLLRVAAARVPHRRESGRLPELGKHRWAPGRVQARSQRTADAAIVERLEQRAQLLKAREKPVGRSESRHVFSRSRRGAGPSLFTRNTEAELLLPRGTWMVSLCPAGIQVSSGDGCGPAAVGSVPINAFSRRQAAQNAP